ncbi:MAG: thiamine pyrophosphate-dependent enzyme, partial [Acidimicrobiales bacterium]
EGLLAMLARAGGTGAGSGGSGRAGGGEGGSVREWAGGHRAYLDWNRLPEPFTSTVSGVSGAGAVPAGTSPDARARAAAGDGAGGGRGIHPAEVVATMARMVPADAIVANDAGNFAGFLHRYWRYNCPHSQLAPTSGAMGYGVPAAVAAKLAAPDRPVIGVVGDGGLLMTGQELETAARLGLPLVVVAFHNALYGTIAMHQARTLGRTAAVDLGSDLDLATWARGLGAKGWRAEDGHELEQALAEAMACGAPALVDVVTDPDVISSTATLSGLLASARVGGSRAG